MNKTLILLRGLPGSGKTTLAKTMGFSNVCADDCWEGEEGFTVEGVKRAHAKCQHVTEAAIENGITPFVVHNTFTTGREMEAYLHLADIHGYTVHTVIVENHHGGESVHNVPESTMKKMENRFNVKL